jgi:hypothetical protein
MPVFPLISLTNAVLGLLINPVAIMPVAKWIGFQAVDYTTTGAKSVSHHHVYQKVIFIIELVNFREKILLPVLGQAFFL